MKKIIIQGDDWGYSEEVNAGIEYSYEYGILTETTALVNLLDINKKSEYKSRLHSLKNKSGLNKPKLGIGIHLNVTYGKPLSPNWPKPEFTRPHKGSGNPEEWIGSAWQKYFSQFTISQIEDEYRRQIELGIQIFGDIDHLDSHHFSAAYDPLKSVYEKFAKEYRLAVRPAAPLSEKPVYGGDFIVKEVDINKIKTLGIKIANSYVLKLFFNEKDPIKSFLQVVDKIEDGKAVEVMFHPAQGQKADSWRVTDLKTLTSNAVLNYFLIRNIQLITYKDL